MPTSKTVSPGTKLLEEIKKPARTPAFLPLRENYFFSSGFFSSALAGSAGFAISAAGAGAGAAAGAGAIAGAGCSFLPQATKPNTNRTATRSERFM
ncbi:MAG: hypothetical protein ACHP6J_00435 [Burkholderiales bacterium]